MAALRAVARWLRPRWLCETRIGRNRTRSVGLSLLRLPACQAFWCGGDSIAMLADAEHWRVEMWRRWPRHTVWKLDSVSEVAAPSLCAGAQFAVGRGEGSPPLRIRCVDRLGELAC